MKVWFDILSGDEMVSDSYAYTTSFEDAALEVKSRLITKGNEDYGISGNIIIRIILMTLIDC